MIARPTSSPLPQEILYSSPYEDPITGYSSSYIPYPSNSYEPAFHSDKRLKIEPQLTQYYLQTLDTSPSFNFDTMQQNQLRTPILSAPHINLHRPSEPASPVTVATTLSQHSTPSPSPSRVTILSDNSNADWLLYDDQMPALAQQSKERRSPHGRHHYNPSSNNQNSQYNPMIVPQLDSSHTNPGFYPGFPYDQNMSMTDFTKMPQQHHFLKPSYPRDYQELAMLQQQQQQQHDDEPPALSPSSHQTTFSGRPSVSEDIHHPVPKLNRTTSDAIEDELFHDSGIDESQHSQKSVDLSSLNPQLARYYQEAQNQHITASKSLTGQLPGGRETSPFRANSPFHPGRSQPSSLPTRHSNFASGFLNTARAQREHQKEIEAEAILSQQLQEELDNVMTPKTISPKDAVLEYPEPEDEASRMSLFPDAQSTNGHGSIAGSISGSSYNGSDPGDEEFSSMATSRRGSEANSIPNVEAYSFHPSPHFMGIPTNLQYLQPLPGRIHQTASDNGASSQVSGADQQTKPASPTSKPAGSRADTGAYTCTEQGCAQRFSTPQKMAKHRRETHTRHTTPGSGMTSALSARHQGPHKCTRINPTTNKPCNTIFSRPYDLTRHEDTIHNTAREKVRCEICNDEKTFSRQDALTRHKKVKHGIDK